MQIQRINLSSDKDENLEVRSASIYFENFDDVGNRISATIAITKEQYEQLESKAILPISLIEPVVIKLLGLGVEDDDVVRFVEIEKVAKDQAATIEELTKNIQDQEIATKYEVERKVDEAKVALKSEIKSEVKTETEAETAAIKVIIRKLIRIDELTPEDVADLVALYDPWESDQVVGIGDIRSRDGKLYKAIQAHTTQADWTPEATPALWTEIAPPATEEGTEIVPQWVQPTGSHDAYNVGDRVIYAGIVYVSAIDGNTWNPSDYPQGWEVLNE